MKKILITGANSYIGTSFENWLKKWPDKYKVDTIDMKDTAWREKSFSGYDAVFHVAGIAHVSTDPKMEDLYYKVNRDLTIETAKKAKADGVKQFIFMSSIIIYGGSSHINQKRIIDKNTIPSPSNFYGKSKLQAEEGILPLQDDNFNLVILRPPMIFGKGSKGNYPKLSKMAQKLPIFPNINNERSMLYIDNLCEFIRLMIDNEERGIFFPQNKEYVRTSELVKLIAEAHGKNIILTGIFNWALIFMGNFVGTVNKAFGNLVYEKSMSEYKVEYRVKNLREAVWKTEVN
ncbi:MAG: NAD-dependent epimerase/dehydratase family protein [Caloramator sp.]|nr:NAD-dependent epimerase/dehydratase family protein [Caloramator sp.]